MPRTIEDLVQRLSNLEADIKTQLPVIVAGYAGDAVAMAIQRVQKEGAKPGAAYSETPIYVTQDVFNRKSAFKPVGKGGADANIKSKYSDVKTRKTKSKIIKKDGSDRTSMYLEHGYKELREIQGLKTDVVNLEYSRRMLQNVKVLGTENKTDFAVVAQVGATNEEEKKKLAGNRKRYGDFLAITPAIADVINPVPAGKLTDLIKQALQ